jgi:neutral trehalase
VGGAYFAADLTGPIGVSTGKRRTVQEIEAAIERQRAAYEQGVAAAGKNGPIVDAIETTLGWDTIYEPDKRRVVSPVSRVWSVGWGGYVLFDWDTFFAATMAAIGDKDLAYADAIETLREETVQGFVPNYARPGGWKSFDRSEPPVGAITVLGLYREFHDHWFLEEAFKPLLSWNRWWAEHRDIQGYLAWGSDGDNQPGNLDDDSRGTRAGAILESGLDNSPMYDTTIYNEKSHLLEFADVGLMSLYIADCDALKEIAEALRRPEEAKELKERAARYRAKLATLWDEGAGIFLNKDLHTGLSSPRLSPTNFYPLLARAATPDQARTMLEKHLLNTKEFWGGWVVPSIARDDPAFRDQDYWRGRIWGPMNYLVYLGLENYEDGEARREFARKSYALFLKEWSEKGHVHENYNAIAGTGDDVQSSDRFYHWGALLGYVEYLEQSETGDAAKAAK